MEEASRASVTGTPSSAPPPRSVSRITSESASRVSAPQNSATDSENRRIELEAQGLGLEEEESQKQQQLLDLEASTLQQGAKAMEEMRDTFGYGERYCRRFELEMRKLEMDLEAAMRSAGDEAVESPQDVIEDTGATFQGNEDSQTSAGKIRLEEKEKVKFQELVRRFEPSVRENSEMKAEISMFKTEKSQDLDRVLHEKLAMEKQNLELRERIEALESENGKEVCKLEKATTDQPARILEVNEALKAVNVELEKRIEVLEMTREAEKRSIRDENVKKVLELDQRINVLEKENREKSEEIKRILGDKTAVESKERKWIEEVKKTEEKCRRLEAEKGKLEMDLDAAEKRAALGYDKVLKKLKAAEAKIKALKECKDGELAMLVKRNKHFDREKIRIKEGLQDWVLKMEQAVNRFTGATYISHVVKQSKECEDLQSSAWKKSLEEDEKMKAKELLLRIEVLEKEKEEMEAEALKLERKVSMVKENALNMNITLEVKEKKITELVQRIEDLEKENMETEVSYANRERSEMERISKEKVDIEAAKRTMKEEAEREISKLVNKIKIFEREKRELEEEIMQKDEVIKVIVQESECLEDKIKKLNNKMAANSAEGTKLSRRVDLASNICILDIPAQNEGHKSALFTQSDEHNRSLKYAVAANIDIKSEDKLNSANACKSKRPLPENLTEDAVSLGGSDNSSTAKRARRGRQTLV